VNRERRIAASICAALSFTQPGAAEAPKGSIEVVFHGLRSETGRLHLALYSDPDGFPSRDGAMRSGVLRVDEDVPVFVFDDVPHGLYAVSAYHDENDNGRFDTNFLGLPLEGYGFSRDAPVMFGPPAFDKAAFQLRSDERTIVVTIRY